MRASTVAVTMLALGTVATGARAQSIAFAGAILVDTQRFPEPAGPNRLDGSTVGWAALVSLEPLAHLVVDAEWSDSTITDARSIALDIEGRAVTIESAFEHRTRAFTLMPGFAHRLGARIRLAYLAGASWTGFERRLTTNAPGLVLAPPSDGSTSRSRLTGRFASFTVGVDALVRLNRHICAFGGARAQALPLEPELSGHRFAVLAGGAWAF